MFYSDHLKIAEDRDVFNNFFELKIFLATMLFAENAEHQGSGEDSLVTKEMYPKIIGCKRKW